MILCQLNLGNLQQLDQIPLPVVHHDEDRAEVLLTLGWHYEIVDFCCENIANHF